MHFDLDQFLLSASTLIDFVEMDVLGVTSNHGKRVAYIAAKMGMRAGLSRDEVFDLIALAVLHDNGLSEEILFTDFPSQGEDRLQLVEGLIAHCELGERNVAGFPFLTAPKGVIRLHHERHDGKGFFGLRGDQTPVMAQIIGMADYVDFLFSFETRDLANRDKIRAYVAEHRDEAVAPAVADLFLEVSDKPAFWLDLQNGFIDSALARVTPQVVQEVSPDVLLDISRVFSRIVDCKSKFTQRHSGGLEDKAARMADFYGFDEGRAVSLRIAAAFHDLGKLAIPNAILDKPGSLTVEEMLRIQDHSYYTRRCLEKVAGFEAITEWASNHHERLDGSGYPLGLDAERLGFECRLLACLDIYQAVTEERPYRQPMTHAEAMAILRSAAARGQLDTALVEDIDRAYCG
jgi:HD-GYP domain-containing protein (c-di-GMP phosphodiesterase class II)